MREGDEPEPELGWVSPEVREEFPELRLLTATVVTAAGPSSPEARQRLRLLSDRFTGARAVGMRREPIPSAYRIFYRHIGLDPDETRPPGEAAAVERLLRGGFRPSNRIDDALLITKASATGPRSASWQLLRICGPRSEHAGRRPAGPWLARLAMSASPLSVPAASGAANGGRESPTLNPREPPPPLLSAVLRVM